MTSAGFAIVGRYAVRQLEAPLHLQAQAEVGLQTATAFGDALTLDRVNFNGETLARIRALIKEADPDVVEEVKWRKPSNPMGIPVWSHDGIICTGETYKEHVKLTFIKGASLKDPSRLFNQDGTVRRAINIREGDTIDEVAFKKLIRAAVAANTSGTGGEE